MNTKVLRAVESALGKADNHMLGSRPRYLWPVCKSICSRRHVVCCNSWRGGNPRIRWSESGGHPQLGHTHSRLDGDSTSLQLVHKQDLANAFSSGASLVARMGHTVLMMGITVGLALGPWLSPPLASSSPTHGMSARLITAASSGFSTSQSPAPAADVSSALEDDLLEATRQVEARMDWALGTVANKIVTLPGLPQMSDEEQASLQMSGELLIREVWEVVDQNYLDARQNGFDAEKWRELRDQALAQRFTDRQQIYRTIRDMLARGLSDPYSRFITPADFSNMKKYDVTGVGLNLGTAEEYVRKTGRPLPGHPLLSGDDPGEADTASNDGGSGGIWVVGISKGSAADIVGVEQGDEIVSIDGKSLAGRSPFQAASLISGLDQEEASTTGREDLVMTVRKEDGTTRKLSLPRPVMSISSPVSSRVEVRGKRRLGWIKLTSFTARAQRDVANAVRALEQEGVTDLVLDLRDNRGGLVTEGLEVARLFLEGDVPIVYTHSKAMLRDAPRAAGPALTNKRLTVMVNDHTASASEILAGALKDHCRAILVGSKTYGKGLIQSVYELSDTSGLVITVGRYVTPDGTDIDRNGIIPNFNALPDIGSTDEALQACRLKQA